MNTFTIDDHNNITAHASAEEDSHGEAAGLIRFDSAAALAKIAATWPLSRLIEIWNSIPGQAPVKKFQDRQTAVKRVWNAIQPLAGQEPARSAPGHSEADTRATQPSKRRKKPCDPGRGRKPAARPQPPQEGTEERRNKKAEVIALMKRSKGATLAEIMQATEWQKHTVRGFVSLLGSKAGLKIESSKNVAGERTYKIAK